MKWYRRGTCFLITGTYHNHVAINIIDECTTQSLAVTKALGTFWEGIKSMVVINNIHNTNGK